MRGRACYLSGAVVVAAAVVGCGASAPSTVTVVAEAASRTISAHTAHVTVTLSLGASGSGSADFQARSVAVDFGSEQITIIGDDTPTPCREAPPTGSAVTSLAVP